MWTKQHKMHNSDESDILTAQWTQLYYIAIAYTYYHVHCTIRMAIKVFEKRKKKLNLFHPHVRLTVAGTVCLCILCLSTVNVWRKKKKTALELKHRKNWDEWKLHTCALCIHPSWMDFRKIGKNAYKFNNNKWTSDNKKMILVYCVCYINDKMYSVCVEYSIENVFRFSLFVQLLNLCRYQINIWREKWEQNIKSKWMEYVL